MTPPPYRTVLVIPDLHARPASRRSLEGHDSRSLAAVLKYAAALHLDQCVILGDFLDYNSVSSHNTGKPQLVEGEDLDQDNELGRALLDDICRAVRRKRDSCDVIYLEGNHEFRCTRLLQAQPQLGRWVLPRNGLELKERGIKWVPSWSEGKLHNVGNAYFTHGQYTNLHHAKKHVEHYGVPIYYGHTHDVQTYSKVLHGRDMTIEGASLGCLLNYEQGYMRGAPDKWQQAITVFQVFPDGYFQRLTAAIFKHRFVGPTNGRVYDGR